MGLPTLDIADGHADTLGPRGEGLAAIAKSQALVTPSIGSNYSPVMLWLDPVWDPIRHDPRFQALLKKYVKSKPAATTVALLESTALDPATSRMLRERLLSGR